MKYAPLAPAIALLAVLVALVAGASFDAVFAKEGPGEHIGHVLLAAIVALLGIVAVRHRWALLIAAFFVIVLGEELDWGGVYAGARHGNFHNAWGGASYLIFALPVVAYFALALVPRTRAVLVRMLGPATPAPPEAAAAIAVGAISLGATLGLPSHEPAMDEASELALYLLVLLIGARAAHAVVLARKSNVPRASARAVGRGSAPPHRDGRAGVSKPPHDA
jgi:hypothetical protein